MDWLVTLGIAIVAAGTVFVLVIGIAVHDLRGHLRRGISDASTRQAKSLRKMAENMTTLQKELREAQAQIRSLVRANRRLSDRLADLSARVDADDDDGVMMEDDDRVLH
ncbi:hypothetical protein IGS68_08090 [Skermanella sp. TT6]|uniref:Uncharacterized protein n=1 Tax=Skermanella cutis TaxID=2775420 RepID=A0ABX7BDP5_9PROT|nr:hypothetical protein [Skermanella sp. TT6]QQP91156.1 hypothetical protein IGS68_08090 [Skermanella sp. TT6]